MNGNGATLNVRGLEFAYGRRSANGHLPPQPFRLGPVSFQLASCEFLSILGPNGSGKTTLLNLIGGLLWPTGGLVNFAGLELCALPARHRAQRVAFVRQESSLVFPIAVEQFVLLGRFAFAGRWGFESADDREMTAWALSACSLSHLAHRRLDEISGGERQRAILARALVQEPELLLLDEPTSGLDINFQIEMLKLVRSLAASHGITAVAVMHDLNLASEFSDYLLLLKDGRLAAYGDPHDVLTREHLQDAYGVPVSIDRHPYSGRPRVTILAGRE